MHVVLVTVYCELNLLDLMNECLRVLNHVDSRKKDIHCVRVSIYVLLMPRNFFYFHLLILKETSKKMYTPF